MPFQDLGVNRLSILVLVKHHYHYHNFLLDLDGLEILDDGLAPSATPTIAPQIPKTVFAV
jgi:hypothetical protein